MEGNAIHQAQNLQEQMDEQGRVDRPCHYINSTGCDGGKAGCVHVLNHTNQHPPGLKSNLPGFRPWVSASARDEPCCLRESDCMEGHAADRHLRLSARGHRRASSGASPSFSCHTEHSTQHQLGPPSGKMCNLISCNSSHDVDIDY